MRIFGRLRTVKTERGLGLVGVAAVSAVELGAVCGLRKKIREHHRSQTAETDGTRNRDQPMPGVIRVNRARQRHCPRLPAIIAQPRFKNSG